MTESEKKLELLKELLKDYESGLVSSLLAVSIAEMIIDSRTNEAEITWALERLRTLQVAND